MRTPVHTPSADVTPVPVPIHDVLALFRPERRLSSLLPTSAHLAELVPGSLRTRYELTPSGTIANEEDRLIRRRFALGQERYEVEVHADQLRGRPSMFCWDFMLAIWRLADEGSVASDGLVEHATYRSLLRAAGRSAKSSDADIRAAKRALARWAGLQVHTSRSVDLTPTRPSLRDGAIAAPPAAWPILLEGEGTHWVLEYDVEREVRPNGSRDFIGHLRINPLWLQQTQAGHAVWINIDLHNQLSNAVAKRLLQLGALRAARGAWRTGEPWIATRQELQQLLDFGSTLRPAHIHSALTEAFALLSSHDAIHVTTRVVGRGQWEYELNMGDALMLTRSYRGIAPYDSHSTRALLWHLRATGLSEREARSLVRENPTQTLEALRYAYWLKLVHHGRGAPHASAKTVTNWPAWIKKAIYNAWEFPMEYHAWAREISNGRALLTTPRTAPVIQATPTSNVAIPPASAREPAPVRPPLIFADNVWGQILAKFAEENLHAYQAWLADTWLISEAPDQLVIGTRNSFAPDWIPEHYGLSLTELAYHIANRHLTIEVRYAPES